MAEIDKVLLEKVSNDRALASAMLFRHRHPQETPPFHIEIMDMWRASDELILIEAFRQAAKSTLSEEFLCLEGCFGNFFYGLIIGETYDKACERLGEIAAEASKNVKIHALFGGKVLARKPIENKVWFKSGSMLQALGWEQELQSFKYMDHRPDRAYLDDPENLERVRDSDAVDASERKFWLELMPAMDKMRRKIVITQTRRAEDCLVTRFAKNPEFVYRAYPICNGDIDHPDTKSLWPDRYSMEWIRQERDRYAGAGRLTEFLQSYMLQASDPEEKPFRDEHIKGIEVAPWQFMPKYVIYDPARKADKKADEYGKVVVSRFGSKIYVHESGGYHWMPDAMINDLFAANDIHQPAMIGVEQNSLNEWVLQPLRINMLNRGVSLPLLALQAPQDRNKQDFIMGLQPFFHSGDIVLVGGRQNHAKLVAEILNFPQGSLNIINALAYSLRMFGGTPIYEDFSSQNIGDTPNISASDTIYLGFNGTPKETVVVAMIKRGPTLHVAADFAVTGAPIDTVKILLGELRGRFPQGQFQSWVNADVYDQWQRIPLVPALRANSLKPFRGEHPANSRGSLSTRIRTNIRNHRALMIDMAARQSCNALAAGYRYAAEKNAKMGSEPENGISRLVAECIECLTVQLDSALNSQGMDGAHMAVNAQGHTYASALPNRR